MATKRSAAKRIQQTETTEAEVTEAGAEELSGSEEISALGQPQDAPPTGGATSSCQMNSTTVASLTPYQYWNLKVHGHHPGAVS